MTAKRAVVAETMLTRLRARTTQLDVGYRQIAAAVGVQKTTAGRWLSGESPIPADKVAAVADTLGVTPSWLEHGTGPKAAVRRPLTKAEVRLVGLRLQANAAAAKLKGLRRQIRVLEAEQAEGLAAAEKDAFLRGES